MDMPNMTMPMSNHSMMMHTGMHMNFYWGHDVIIFFKDWPNYNHGMYILALLVVFFLAFTLEVLSATSEANLGTSPITGGLTQASVYAVRMAVGYLVMLSVMSYNIGVFIVAVAGHAFGHFVVMFRAISQAKANTEEPNKV